MAGNTRQPRRPDPRPLAVIRTPSGGAHLYFPGTSQRNGSLPASALDFCARGRYILAPPSWSAARHRRYHQLTAQPAADPIDRSAIRALVQPANPTPRARPPAGDLSAGLDEPGQGDLR